MLRTIQAATLAATAVFSLASSLAYAQNWNPSAGWKDSYAVDGVCYCDSNGYDHGIGDVSVDTPAGNLKIPQICADIKSVLGEGRSSGRIPYNDIQCGNGPANDAADETGCPGRVDIGSAGCDVIGPEWDLEAVYGGTVNPVVTPDGQQATASNNAGDANLAIDGNSNTRWATRQNQQPGQYFELDLGETETFNRVILETDANPNDYPAGYSLAVSNNGSNYRVVASGSGDSAVTTISFPDQSARYIRITQTGSKDNYWWSIHEIETALADSPVNDDDALDRANWTLVASNSNNDVSNAIDGNANSRWSTDELQGSGQSFEIDLSSTRTFSRIVLDTNGSSNDYPRGFTVQVSDDGNNWSSVSTGAGDSAVTTIAFAAQTARYIRIEQTGADRDFWWSIHEVNVYE